MRAAEEPEIAALPLFRDMGQSERERIFSGSFLQLFPPQLTLFDMGQRADFLHVLVDGLAELYTSVGDRETTMRIVTPVHSFILAAVMTDMPYLMSARTLEASRVLLVPAALVREIVKKDTALMEATMKELALAYRNLVLTLADMKLRQSTERLARYILKRDAEQGGTGEVKLPAEKRVLASLLGMTPENLSRSFAFLKDSGVSAQGASIAIGDRIKLEALARPDFVPR
jgi:CRP/FNR family transcriptional activator FtrB